jgi:hypothetical protein
VAFYTLIALQLFLKSTMLPNSYSVNMVPAMKQDQPLYAFGFGVLY